MLSTAYCLWLYPSIHSSSYKSAFHHLAFTIPSTRGARIQQKLELLVLHGKEKNELIANNSYRILFSAILHSVWWKFDRTLSSTQLSTAFTSVSTVESPTLSMQHPLLDKYSSHLSTLASVPTTALASGSLQFTIRRSLPTTSNTNSKTP